ncbi:hypothetical protein SprV_0301360300 [Sparganum proliferum]
MEPTEFSLTGLNLTTTGPDQEITGETHQPLLSKPELNYEFEQFCPPQNSVKAKLAGQPGMPVLEEVDESQIVRNMTSRNSHMNCDSPSISPLADGQQRTQSNEVPKATKAPVFNSLSKENVASLELQEDVLPSEDWHKNSFGDYAEGTSLDPPATVAAFKDIQGTGDRLANVRRSMNSHHSCLSKAPEHWKASPVVPSHAFQAKKLLTPGYSPDRPTPTYRLCFTLIQSRENTDNSKWTRLSDDSPPCPETKLSSSKSSWISRACQTDHAQFLVNKAVQVSPVKSVVQCDDLEADEKALETKRWIERIMHT